MLSEVVGSRRVRFRAHRSLRYPEKLNWRLAEINCATDRYDLAHPRTAFAYGEAVDMDGDLYSDALPTTKSDFLGNDVATIYTAAGRSRRDGLGARRRGGRPI